MAARDVDMTDSYFSPGFFRFLAELKANNNRDWFTANKTRYLAEVETPMLRFIADFGERLGTISPSFVADPRRTGGSMFRIYRDTRFSKDKTPYKASIGAQFPHLAQARDRAVPGFYIHFEPGVCVGGGGVHHPDGDSLKRIRDRIIAEPEVWEAVLRNGMKIEGDALKRPPPGYDPEHRFVDDLKRKDFYGMVRFTEREACLPGFLEAYVGACARVAPLVEFLARALGLSW